jgi:WD40 repeat protein
MDQTLRLWDANNEQIIGQPLKGHESFVNSVAFSPDGARIISGSADKTLRLWNAFTGQPIGPPLKGHLGEVSSVAFSPDGTRIVSGSYDKTLWLWDVKTGQPIGQPLKGHENEVSSVAFSPNGTRIVSGSRDNTLRLWPVFEGWADELCKKLNRNMSHQEWRDWVSPDIDYIEQCPGLPIPPDEPEVTTATTEETHP